ncbi:MAG: hypothetical protein M1819_005872 [Sarea resinae]|nr:MAG: hypothetical protein M1819_005872 [Sarea resinae]
MCPSGSFGDALLDWISDGNGRRQRRSNVRGKAKILAQAQTKETIQAEAAAAARSGPLQPKDAVIIVPMQNTQTTGGLQPAKTLESKTAAVPPNTAFLEKRDPSIPAPKPPRAKYSDEELESEEEAKPSKIINRGKRTEVRTLSLSKRAAMRKEDDEASDRPEKIIYFVEPSPPASPKTYHYIVPSILTPNASSFPCALSKKHKPYQPEFNTQYEHVEPTMSRSTRIKSPSEDLQPTRKGKSMHAAEDRRKRCEKERGKSIKKQEKNITPKDSLKTPAQLAAEAGYNTCSDSPRPHPTSALGSIGAKTAMQRTAAPGAMQRQYRTHDEWIREREERQREQEARVEWESACREKERECELERDRQAEQQRQKEQYERELQRPTSWARGVAEDEERQRRHTQELRDDQSRFQDGQGHSSRHGSRRYRRSEPADLDASTEALLSSPAPGFGYSPSGAYRPAPAPSASYRHHTSASQDGYRYGESDDTSFLEAERREHDDDARRCRASYGGHEPGIRVHDNDDRAKGVGAGMDKRSGTGKGKHHVSFAAYDEEFSPPASYLNSPSPETSTLSRRQARPYTDRYDDRPRMDGARGRAA